MLFVRSAEAVQNHIKTAGFDFSPSDDDEEDVFSTASADESLSDNETVSVRAASRKDRQWKLPLTKIRSSGSGKQPTPPIKANTRRRRSRSRSRSPSSTNRSRSRSTSSSGITITDDEDEQPHPAPWSLPPHHPAHAMRPPMFPGPGPAPIHPMFRPSNALPFRMPGPGAFPFPHASHFPAPPGPGASFHPPPPAPAALPMPQPSPPPQPRDISLHILVHRPNHPTPLDRRLLAQAPLMSRAIEEVARDYVRRDLGDNGRIGLTVALQKVVLPGGVEYDLSGWRGGDLRGLVEGANGGGRMGGVPHFVVSVRQPVRGAVDVGRGAPVVVDVRPGGEGQGGKKKGGGPGGKGGAVFWSAPPGQVGAVGGE